MAAILWLTMSLLVIHMVDSYVLLTANVDDVQAIAKQMFTSPVVSQIGKIWRRAASQFNRRLNKPISQRAGTDSESDESNASSGLSDDLKRSSRRALDDLTELGRNATVYLKSLRRVFNDLMKE